jgi:DNA-binding NarL/FixJ family response regulator
MKVLVQGHTLTVGLNGKGDALDELPIELISVDTAAQAVACLKSERFDCVVSRWHLEDMDQGGFQRRLRAVRPDTATIVLVSGDNPGEEILARSIGVSAVLTEDCSDELLLATVAAVLGIEIPAVVPVENI